MQTALMPNYSVENIVIIPEWKWGTPVTMQVAFKGVDGLVLASDMKSLTRERSIGRRNTLEQISGTRDYSKIKLGQHDMAVAFSGNSIKDDEATDDLIEYLSGTEKNQVQGDITELLKTWGNNFYARKMPQDSRTHNDVPIGVLLIVNPNNPFTPLWKLSITRDSRVNPSNNVLTNGNVHNPGTFWIEYLKADRTAELKLTVKQLCWACALVIYSAADINPHGIGGLEIKVYQEGKWKSLSEGAISAFYEQYNSLLLPVKESFSRA
jgi:hypothetical protein